MAETTTKEKLTPQSFEAEQSTLGAMLIDRDAIARAVEVVHPKDFYWENHRHIAEAILALFDKGQPVDLITLAEALKAKNQLEAAGGVTYLTFLIDSVPSAANVAQYAKIVETKAILRNLIQASSQIAGWAYDGTDSVDDLVDRSEKMLFDVGQRRLGAFFYPIRDLLHSTFDRIDQQYHHKGQPSGTPTGYPDLDALLAGLQKSDMIIVAGRPSMGKTAFALNIAENVALTGAETVAIFSLEMSKEQLVQRLICSGARVDSNALRSGFLQESDFTKIGHACDELSRAKLFIDDTPSISTFEMRAKARRLKVEHGLGLVVIDYLQLVHSPTRSENRTQQISEIARTLKSMARELDVPVIALSQLSRAVEQRDDKRPMLSDLRESGSIEAEADVVMFLYRPEYYRREKEGEPPRPESEVQGTEVIIGKQRNGPTGTAYLGFHRKYAKFVLLTEEDKRALLMSSRGHN